jgi:RNA polymerase sigma factor (sigma-70 family)
LNTVTFVDAAEFAEFSKFYRESTPGLMAFLRYLGASFEDAADCVQDTMEKALPPAWSTLANPMAWCRVTCHRAYLSHIRRIREQLVAEIEEVNHPLVSPDIDYDAREELHEIVKLIRRMQVGRRRDVLAYRFAGAEYREIADALDITEDNARSTYRYAMRDLKELRAGGEKPS